MQLLIAECGYGQRCHRIVDIQLYKPRSHNGVDHDVHNAQHPAHDHQLQRHRHVANAARQRGDGIFNVNGRIDLATADITGYANGHSGRNFKECVQNFRCMHHRPPANNNFQHNQCDLLDRKSVVAAVHGNALGGIVQLQNHKKRQQGQRHRHDHAGAYAVGIARQGAVPVCQAAEQTRILPHRVDRGRNALQLAAYRIFKNSAALLYPTVSVPK